MTRRPFRRRRRSHDRSASLARPELGSLSFRFRRKLSSDSGPTVAPSSTEASGINSTNPNRRRRAVSSRAIDRSAVFMVPMSRTFGGHPERRPAQRQDHRLAPLVLLDERQQLAEDAGDVAPVDLVDDQVACRRARRWRPAHLLEDPVPAGRGASVPVQFGAVALDEVLVAVRRVERHASQARCAGA